MLIKDIIEVKRWMPFNTFNKLDTIEAYLASAERKYLIPLLGTSLYKHIHKAYEEGYQKESEALSELITLSQAVIVNFGMYTAAPFLNVTVNQSGGMTVTINTNTVAASKDRTDKLTEGLLKQSYDSIEQLLLFMEINSKSFKDEEGDELWKKSDYYYHLTGSLIFTAAEFNDFVYIDNSRLTFHRLIPALRMIERSKIRPNFGNKLIDELIRRKMSKTLTDTDKELLNHLQAAIALLTISTDAELSKPDSIHGEKPFDARIAAENELTQAKMLIKRHASEYPDYPGNIPVEKPLPESEIKREKYTFVMGGPML